MRNSRSLPILSNHKSEIILLILAISAIILTVFLLQERTQKAPDFQAKIYPNLEESFKLSDHKNKPVLINFWASWCVPCEVEFPHIQKMREIYNETDLAIFGINSFDLTEDAIQFTERLNISFQTGPDLYGKINELYQITGLPVTILVDKKGIIRQKKIGYIDDVTLKEWLVEELG
jgi:thiol-disulfide isomerase/thioredoxin